MLHLVGCASRKEVSYGPGGMLFDPHLIIAGQHGDHWGDQAGVDQPLHLGDRTCSDIGHGEARLLEDALLGRQDQRKARQHTAPKHGIRSTIIPPCYVADCLEGLGDHIIAIVLQQIHQPAAQPVRVDEGLHALMASLAEARQRIARASQHPFAVVVLDEVGEGGKSGRHLVELRERPSAAQVLQQEGAVVEDEHLLLALIKQLQQRQQTPRLENHIAKGGRLSCMLPSAHVAWSATWSSGDETKWTRAGTAPASTTAAVCSDVPLAMLVRLHTASCCMRGRVCSFSSSTNGGTIPASTTAWVTDGSSMDSSSRI
mmetsp:Transcript_31782/g.78807  ORF Transcript_31782/g.78807 Transcript_31782/m.78807 type:complete len:315 (+) Transcript_31782:984-1928(+)